MSLTKLSLVLTVALSFVSGAARADEATLKDIQKTLGMVPGFFKGYPEEALPAAWAEFKGLQLNPKSAIPGKYKELIGLAVSAQIPCRYCVYFHTEAAKLNGASDREVKEAVALAGNTRKWSTILNGNQTDLGQFRAELSKAFANAAKGPAGPGAPVTDGPSALKDVERSFGVVPGFFKAYPPAAFAGAWNQFKVWNMTETSIPGKYRELVGLAVASQVPCSYCVVAHTEAARLNGATDDEIREAVAMAGLTRQWSTWLNGTLQDEASFRKDVDQIVGMFKKQMARR
jgi:AhpD family alkylhydroperoxidase